MSASNLRIPPLPGAARQFIDRAARSDLPVLLEGETGTGKSMLAALIHRSGTRAQHPFISANCAAIAPTLIEAELFGRERGAYTGASQAAPGLAEQAHRGTLLLDEIAELCVDQQAKLLSVVEDRKIRRVGGTRLIAIDVRMISATNRRIRDEVARGTFRADLYYRCCGMRFELPPLRRRTDFPAVLDHVLSELAAGEAIFIHSEAVDILRRYHWPGNIRELYHVLGNAIAMTDRDHVRAVDLPSYVRYPQPPQFGCNAATGRQVRRNRYKAPPSHEEERARILTALDEALWNRRVASELLGMSRVTLWERIRYYRLTPESPRSDDPFNKQD